MSVSVDEGGGGGKKSLDVDINLVPFIDMMSCLVAFLMITAVWTNLAQIAGKPKGLSNSSERTEPPKDRIFVSVLVAQDSLWIGATNGDRRQIKKTGEDYDFVNFESALSEFKSLITEEYDDIEIAAEDGVQYQQIISVMDSAVTKKFTDVGFTDPASLTVKFKQ